MHRFFVPPDCFEGQSIIFPGNVARQLIHVLRVRPGDSIVVLDDSGFEYMVTLTNVNSHRTVGTITEKKPNYNEPKIKLVLYQGVLKATKLEFVLQKGTELGVHTFIPISSVRSVTKGTTINRTVRWRKIITEAAEQAGRGRIPILEKTKPFFNACNEHEGVGIIPWEQEHNTDLKSVVRQWKNTRLDIKTISIFVGPEGGFSREEIEYAKSKGIIPVSLGRRILRAETGGIATTALILYEFGDLGM